MATPLYESSIKVFLRRVGEGNITFTYASGVNLSINSKRYTLDMIYEFENDEDLLVFTLQFGELII